MFVCVLFLCIQGMKMLYHYNFYVFSLGVSMIKKGCIIITLFHVFCSGVSKMKNMVSL